MKLTEPDIAYGQGDATYMAVGGTEGLRGLVEHFYDFMDRDSRVAQLRMLHRQDLTESREKLTAFLSGWMGGPGLYQKTYGSISIPAAHAQLSVDQGLGEQWLLCMQGALTEMSYPEKFQKYLMAQLRFPVNMIVQRSQQGKNDKA